MRVLVWIVEETWRSTVRAASALVPTGADVTLLYVTDSQAEAVARVAPHGLLGRHPHPGDPALDALSKQAARELLEDAESLLGRPAGNVVRRGRVEQEVLAAAEGMDVLVLARDGDCTHRGPRSLGRAARFVVDHAPCAVLLVWADGQLHGTR